MVTAYPGTTVEVSSLTRNASKTLFDGIFAAGGITLSQVSVMTGLEPYLIQNWVKRGFVTAPQKRLYSREQFAGIVIINMLREVLQIERICHLMHAIGASSKAPDDDLIRADELYHRYVNMICEERINPSDPKSVLQAAKEAAADFEEPFPGARARLVNVLEVMLYAHASATLHRSAEASISRLG
ncbi:MAG: DUF1836 domain-containing protein [Ruminococcaceae bacterium]|nr:DUF1836 domain-containing protein [Oscillospiraceae bacterium]